MKMNEYPSTANVPQPKPTIDTRLERLLEFVHQSAEKAHAIEGELFGNSREPCIQPPTDPAGCIETKIILAVEKADETLKTLTNIQNGLY